MKWLRNLFRSLQGWLYMTITVLGAIAFIGALSVEQPQQDVTPPIGVGFFAALIAMCVAACALLKAATEPKNPRLIEFMMAIGICASAYLWVSAESGLHPTNPELPFSLFALFIVIGAITLAVPLVAYFRGRQADKGTSENDEP